MTAKKKEVEVAKKKTKSLDGILAIGKWINRSETTVLKLIRQANLPAKKMGGVWVSNTDLMEKWKAALQEGKQMDLDWSKFKDK